MSRQDFDVIVVGARCAGSPAAMLLARKGYKVLAVDRATFPSDTLSTHVVQPHAVARLARWGLLDRVVASGCPAIHTYAFDFGAFEIAGSPGTADAPLAYCPRRTVLDEILAGGAVEAGVELREGFAVEEVLVSDGRITGIRGRQQGAPSAISIRASLVIGADGRNSVVAEAACAPSYNERPALQGGYYAYWSGLPLHGRFETHIGQGSGFAAAETHDGLTMIVGGWPLAVYQQKKRDHQASYLSLFDNVPSFRDRMQGARIESKVMGGSTPNYFRKPYGPGWALLGDAGYLKDPVTAQGIADAFRDAELLTDAIDAWQSGTLTFESAMAGYQTTRDAQSLPMFEFTCELAKLQPPPPELATLLGAVHGNHEAMDQFCRVNAGTLSPAVFFAEANIAQIMRAAQQARNSVS